jgi:hypothetical protein
MRGRKGAGEARKVGKGAHRVVEVNCRGEELLHGVLECAKGSEIG